MSDLQASLSTLILSIGSNAAMSLGFSSSAQGPENTEPLKKDLKVDLEMARFNIDLLGVIKDKTKSNLNKEEQDLLSHMISDLQFKFVEEKNKQERKKKE